MEEINEEIAKEIPPDEPETETAKRVHEESPEREVKIQKTDSHR